MKSSLKTFLAGKNPYNGWHLKESKDLEDFPSCYSRDKDGTWWYVDVLDDGTAITYCPDGDN
jgi:hypothetical protein